MTTHEETFTNTLGTFTADGERVLVTRYRIGWHVQHAVTEVTGEGRMELRETFATISDALRAAADVLDKYDVPIGYSFDITETTRED